MGDVILLALKIILTVLFLPIVIPMVQHFYPQLAEYPPLLIDNFLLGIFVFLGIFLFINQLFEVFEFGQKAIASLFTFLAPFDKVIANVVPFFLPVFFIIFYVTIKFVKITDTDPVFMFLIGFSFALHLICSAQDLQNQEKSIFKPSYLFKMVFIIIVNACLLFFLLDLCFDKSTTGAYLSVVWADAKSLYLSVFERLMIIK